MNLDENNQPNHVQNVFPSLDLSFDWVKNVLDDQSAAADTLEGKATTLFTVASAVLGVGVSAGLLSLHSLHMPSLLFGGLSLASYGFVIGYTFAAIKLRRYETLDDPIEIRKWYWALDPIQFKLNLLSHLEDSYAKNERNLREKANAVRYLIAATAAEVIFLAALLAFGVS